MLGVSTVSDGVASRGRWVSDDFLTRNGGNGGLTMVSVATSRTLQMVPCLIAVCLVAAPIQAKYGGGSGTAQNPYQIARAEHLIALGTTQEDYDKYFVCVNDIDLAGHDFSYAVIAWDYYLAGFAGVLDGKGHAVKNLVIYGPEHNWLGLIGYVTANGCVMNLTIRGGRITGKDDVGGLVGRNNGLVSCCHAYELELKGVNSIGGLVGENYGRVQRSCSTCKVAQVNVAGGGLMGSNSDGGIVSNCYSTGNVDGTGYALGGLVGWNYRGSVSRCYSTGVPTRLPRAGGLVGMNDHGGTVEESFWDIQSSGIQTSAGGIGLTTAEMEDIQPYASAGWDFVGEAGNGTDDIWLMPSTPTYPQLAPLLCTCSTVGSGYSGGSGTAEDPYQISTAADLMTLAGRSMDYDKHFVCVNDVDLSGYRFSKAVIAWDYYATGFSGVLDGRGHSIKMLTIDASTYNFVGLIGYVAPGGRVMNLGAWNARVVGNDDVGCLVGRNDGDVESCDSQGTATGRWGVGGLVGRNRGRISDSHSEANVYAFGTGGGLVGTNDLNGDIESSCANGCVSGTAYNFGGLSGDNYGRVSDCYSTGSFASPPGNTPLGDFVGGLVLHYS